LGILVGVLVVDSAGLRIRGERLRFRISELDFEFRFQSSAFEMRVEG
jgi:hypothetical protein